MSRSVIKKIAKQNRVSVAEVRRDIQAAIDAAYENPNTAALAVPRNGAIPTPEEFIDYCADVINTKPLRMHVLHWRPRGLSKTLRCYRRSVFDKLANYEDEGTERF